MIASAFDIRTRPTLRRPPGHCARYIRAAQHHPNAPRLTSGQVAAKELLDLHSREADKDSDVLGDQRHLPNAGVAGGLVRAVGA
jgi:DNA-nicking Smr family endonuclease